ncbi:MAG: zinc ABC transporter substrate-binding protein, partial [Deltaproteobacteria bacterium]|nr:zinc ABC transporter substrate-binding protein [Deltaproteobacteria bacterium]
MRRTVSLFLAILAGCWIGAVAVPASGEPLNVVTSVIPVAYIVEELGGERVTVHALVPPGASPHTFEPVPSDLRTLAGARVFVAIGGGFDGWSDRLLGAAPKGIEAMHLIEAPNLNPVEGEDDHHGEETAKEEDHHGEEKVAKKEEDHHGEEKVAKKEEDHHGEEKVAKKEEDHHGEEKVAKK